MIHEDKTQYLQIYTTQNIHIHESRRRHHITHYAYHGNKSAI